MSVKKSSVRNGVMRSYLAVPLEIGQFLWARKLWWMVPMVVSLLMVAALAFLASSTPASPFIYTLF